MTEKRYEVIDKIIEYGIYVYIFFMFLAKGEGIRNILIFGNFVLWLITLSHRNNKYLLKEPVSILFWTYLGLVPLSVLFSIDPLFSFFELKDEPLKSALLFPVIATAMDHEEKFKKMIHVAFFALILVVLSAYYSFIYHDVEMLKPDTFLVHAWHNRFARYLCILIPFSFILYFIWNRRGLRILLTIALLFSFIALFLSTSRTGIAAFAGILFIWSLYLSRRRKQSFMKIIMAVVLIFSLAGTLLYYYVPDVNRRVNDLSRDLHTFNERTEIWVPALHAIINQPVMGWGYGDRIFHLPEPYGETPYKNPPEKGPHNSFIKLMFHQGIIGLIPYVTMLLTAIAVFWKKALESTGVKSYVLVASASILIGNYILHAMLTSPVLIYLVVILALGMAAQGIREDRDH